MQTPIDCVLMRGGTSRGPVFRGDCLPADPAKRDRVLLAAMGSPHELQVDGLGGANTLTSKVAIVSVSRRDDCDIDYLFAQVNPFKSEVDTRPNCGNMLSAAAPFALEQGLFPAQQGETAIRVHNVNSGAVIEAVVQTPEGKVTYEGSTRIDGVPGMAAAIALNFIQGWGGVTGSLFPTGQRQEVIDSVRVTCIDAAIPLVLVCALDLGLAANESAATLDTDRPLLVRLEALRLEAGRRMGLGDVSGGVLPKPVIVQRDGQQTQQVLSRYFTPHACHRAHAVTGAIGVAAARVLPGTVLGPHENGNPLDTEPGTHEIFVAHPSGRMLIRIETALQAGSLVVSKAGVVRTARKIMQGQLFIPSHLFH